MRAASGSGDGELGGGRKLGWSKSDVRLTLPGGGVPVGPAWWESAGWGDAVIGYMISAGVKPG